MSKTQREAIIEAMRGNGGYATIGELYHKSVEIPDVTWKTKVPFASIRRIVQEINVSEERKAFVNLRTGLWALREALPDLDFAAAARGEGDPDERQRFEHDYYQGLLVDIGNLQNFTTYVPPESRDNLFLGRPLGELMTTTTFHPFGYPDVVAKARTFDVVWFNGRKMPSALLDVVAGEAFDDILLAFEALQDYNGTLAVIAHQDRQNDLDAAHERTNLKELRGRVAFWDYDYVEKLHESTARLALMGHPMLF
ncbi:MAG: hypothetical protein U5L04_12290 [Trueperaceae bacterium]|nr:hypothetical protein [Trueperaceae bacterium]